MKEKTSKTKYTQYKKGFTLFVALVVASAVLLGSYAVGNALFTQLKQSSSNRDSQKAFAAADNGLECAQYWDAQGESAFAPSPLVSTTNIECGGKIISSDDDIGSLPDSVVIFNAATTTQNIFEVTYDDSTCAVVSVVKDNNDYTTIESRGYNVCDPDAPRRIERAVRVRY